jgi:hypothetical protein
MVVLRVKVDVGEGEEEDVKLELATVLLVEDVDGGMIEVVSVGIDNDGTERKIDGVEIEEEEVATDTKDVELVRSAKEAVLESVKKGTEEISFARVPFAIAVFEGEVTFPFP